jgi:hypothetical protein
LQDTVYNVATGGTITTSGDFKIHTFTGPGTFCVSNAGNPLGSTSVDYMVVAGGVLVEEQIMIEHLEEEELVVIENLLVQLLVVIQVTLRCLCFSFTCFSSRLSNYSWSWWSRCCTT